MISRARAVYCTQRAATSILLNSLLRSSFNSTDVAARFVQIDVPYRTQNHQLFPYRSHRECMTCFSTSHTMMQSHSLKCNFDRQIVGK